MAEHRIGDEVNGIQSIGGIPPVDVSGNSHKSFAAEGVEEKALEEQQRILEKTEKPTNPQITDHTTQHALPTRNTDIISNGTNYTGSEDANFSQSVLGDAAVASDTDSRADSVDHTKADSNRHERTNSGIKRPASFRSVSVTKNFLAKSGAAVAAVTSSKSTADKAPAGSGSSTPTLTGSRPRLVAKSGRDSRGPGSSAGFKNSSGPDASQVWNRNRPVPPPPPKQFTDEELKQRYGIHMTARLQADENGKESKWADIDDDDEDDWAPEAVQWMDGTKSVPTPSNAVRNKSSPQRSESPQKQQQQQQQQQQQPPPPPPPPQQQLDRELEPRTEVAAVAAINNSQASLGPGKTILRPGARPQPSATLKPGLVLKSVPDSANLSGNAPAIASTKSPWATLPPVDKVSPIVFAPPVDAAKPQELQHAISSEAGESIDRAPAREIAAESFDRSWRDDDRRNPSQLFNSHSGRYEPVRNNRRPSFRGNDPNLKTPSVLQRSSHFDSTRSTQDARNWAPRRGSSHASEGDSQSFRRDSTDIGAGLSQPSANLISTPTPETIKEHPQPSAQEVNSISARPAPAETPGLEPTSRPNSFQAGFHAAQSDEDARVVQQRLMREKIEANRKRKQEEEAKEEAARMERIRLKMEALDRLTQKEAPKTTTTDNTTQASPEKREATVAQPHTSQTAMFKAPQSEASQQAKATASQHPILQTKMPSPPTHVTKPTTSFVRTDTKPTTTSSTPLQPSHAQLTPPKSPGQPLQAGTHSVSDTGLSSVSQGLPPSVIDAQPRSTFDRQPGGWHGVTTSHSAAGWSGAALASHGAPAMNVWGPPTNDRQLGNGAFDSGLKGIAMTATGNSSRSTLAPGPGPIAPPSVSPRVVGDNGRFQASPVHDVQRPHHAMHSHAPAPIGPPQADSRSHHLGRQPRHMDPARAAWYQLADRLPQDDAESFAQNKQHAEEMRRGSRQAPQLAFQETFRQTKGENLGERSVVSVSSNVHATESKLPSSSAQDASPAQRLSHQTVASQPLSGQVTLPSSTHPNGRSSRFFGPGADLQHPHQHTTQMTSALQEEMDSQPPPEEMDHPAHAHTTVTGHPLVKLPKNVTVKLPPPQTSAQPAFDSVIMPARFAPARFGGIQPIVANTAWQSRFNELFKRDAPVQQVSRQPAAVGQYVSQGQTAQAPAITSHSKAPLESLSVHGSTTVTLPPTPSASVFRFSWPADRIQSKPSEELLMDDREFGSSPTVKLAPYRSLEQILLRPKISTTTEYAELQPEFNASAEEFMLGYTSAGAPSPVGFIGIRIKLSFRMTEIIKTMPRKTFFMPSSSTRSARTRGKDKPRGRKTSTPHTPSPVTEAARVDEVQKEGSQSRRLKWTRPEKSENNLSTAVRGEHAKKALINSAESSVASKPDVAGKDFKRSARPPRRTASARGPLEQTQKAVSN